LVITTLLSWPLSYRQKPGLRAIERLVFGAPDKTGLPNNMGV
jgi:hypothetical protein